MSKTDIMNFALVIEGIAKDKNISYIDAIIHHCDLVGMEVEVAAKLIGGTLKSKLELEAQKLHMVKPKRSRKRLPINEQNHTS